ncbi:acyl-CoA dehydrogenase [Actinomadura sp. LD22]|uniref:Acyl-CoA dehydrogenase n=1 Tax=Actinomadura physcomitrii TaxID=2650748 RepID=A0A6I4MIC9_9ACTN|nr:acyl-CoA dehydrogenase family protein [Actinomadura physcomitrii]MWA02399.1 acyl-CoA dehydrogenase [Actinomadura physcomitrii]
MDVRLSAEQRALREAAARLVDDHAPGSVADLDDAARVAGLEAALAGAGWRELRAPDPGGDGRPLASAVEAAIVAEEFGRGPADTPFLGPTLAAELRRRAGAEPAGALETVLLRPDLSGLVVLDERGTRCSGVAIDARGATAALALARTGGGGHDLVQVPVGGTSPGRDLTRPASAVGDAPAERLTAGGPLSATDIEAWSAFALALTCADLVGTMRGAVGLARAYAGVRRQYEALIGTFQSVQHLLADAFVSVEGSSSVTRHAAWAADALPAGEALAAAAVAKAYCARAAREVCETAIQVHGGIGMTWECLAHVHLRRALVSAQLLGDVGVNLARVAAHHEIGGGHDGLR